MERRRALKDSPWRRPSHGKVSPGARRARPAFDFDDVVYGLHAVDEALIAGERLRAVHVADDRKKDAPLRDMVARAKEMAVPVRFEPRTFFSTFPFKAHQGVVAIGPPFAYASLHELLAAPRTGPRLFVVLDHLTDPHNVGAIVRTAECVRANGLLLPDRRSAGINATVRKSAAGAAAHLPIARVGNLGEAIRTLKAAGVWIVGADTAAPARPMGEIDLTSDVALVIGAEGTGLSPAIRRACDHVARIPMLGRVASLNASVAAAVLLYEVLRQRGYAAADR